MTVILTPALYHPYRPAKAFSVDRQRNQLCRDASAIDQLVEMPDTIGPYRPAICACGSGVGIIGGAETQVPARGIGPAGIRRQRFSEESETARAQRGQNTRAPPTIRNQGVQISVVPGRVATTGNEREAERPRNLRRVERNFVQATAFGMGKPASANR